MKKIYRTILKSALTAAILVCVSANASAKWEQVYELTSTYACHVSKSGNLIVSDYQYVDYSGGIYISEDNGETWTKTNAEDHCYSQFIEAGGYIFAGGEGCRVARSADEGKTWEVMNFSYVYADYLDEDALTYNPCYAMAYHKDKLYVGDFNGGGIAYSEDFGETWTLTDRESLMYDISGSEKAPEIGMQREKATTIVESFYSLESFNGSLYAFGVYFVFRLNEETGLWEVLRNDSNFMGTTMIFGDKLVCGRAVMNYTDQVPFLEWTEDGETWGAVKRPEGLLDNNVRAMACDDSNIFVGLQTGGMYYTPDFGESWGFISDGLPEDGRGGYYHLIMISVTEDYVYCVIYDTPWSGTSVSGLYRLAKSDIPSTSVNTINSDEIEIFADSHNLNVEADCQYVDIYTIDGVVCRLEAHEGKADISMLDSGVYIYATNKGNKGKFVKK